MKTLKKAISFLISSCLIAGLFVMTPMSASAEEPAQTAPHTYELYDYFDAYKTAYANNTAFVNPSAWSMQTKKYNSDTWVSNMDVCDTTVDSSWHYIRPNYDIAWVYSAGFAYQIYEAGGRYMNAMAIPANLSTNSDFNYNVAYAFTAPQDGIYSVGKADQNKVWSFYDTDAFHKMSSDEKLDFGVRITVNNQTIWPTSDNTYYRDGWAEFGDLNAKTAYLNVPTLDNITMSKDSVLRVEFTQFTPCGMAWNQRILGMVAVTYVKPAPIERPVPTTDQLPISYEVYDFYNGLINQTGSDSPWEVAVSQDGTWHTVDRTFQEGDYYYMHYNGIEWGGNWPGCKIFRPADYQSLDRYYYGFITPSNGGTALHTNAAYSFTTPFTGNYEFGKCSRDKCYSFYDMDYIRVDGSLPNADYGVRLTVDGDTVWPEENNSLNNGGWIHFGTAAGLTNGIEIPELDLYLEKNQVVRMEFADFAGMEWPWNNSISGIPSITLKNIDGIAVSNTREFEDAGLYLDEFGIINTYFALIDGDKLHSKNIATAANDSVSLQVQADTLGNGIKVGINGFNFVLNGTNSSLTSPTGVVETKTIPVADNGIYNIYFDVLPAFAGNAITGTLVCATVNGVSYEKLFTGEMSVGAANGGIIFENNTGAEIYIMPGAPVVKSNSGLVYNNKNRVLYVGDKTDLTEIKGLMENADRYFFAGDVVTGSTFIRTGNDVDLMTYSFAVKGDVNSDGSKDIKDLVRMKKATADAVTLTAAQDTAAKFGDLSKTDLQAIIDIRKDLLSK